MEGITYNAILASPLLQESGYDGEYEVPGYKYPRYLEYVAYCGYAEKDVIRNASVCACEN